MDLAGWRCFGSDMMNVAPAFVKLFLSCYSTFSLCPARSFVLRLECCSMALALEFDHISKEYKRFAGPRIAAIHDFSLQVQQGEIFGFLGPNGAGKTTAIHLAMGFMRATSGTGRMLQKPFGHAQTRRKVGFLAENVALYARPAEQLVRFYGGLNGLAGRTLKERAAKMLAEVGLSQEARRNVGRFSRGMVQRVGLAQALINDPDLLILDEPTSALDPLSRVHVRELLLRLRDSGKTVFLSSHLLSEVELVCDRVAILNHGRLVALGKTSELLQSGGKTEIVARGIPASAFAGATVSNGLIRFAVPVSEQRAAVETIWRLGGELVRLAPEQRSLEEVFLQLTNSAPGESGSHISGSHI
jgi:ABC-2 type transport system ATP-binding protein